MKITSGFRILRGLFGPIRFLVFISGFKMLNYYVYAYINQLGHIYYIGKGTKNRAWVVHKNISRPFKVVIMENHLTEIGAFALERFYIRWYGRLIDNSGPLENKHEGGPLDFNKPSSPNNTSIKPYKEKVKYYKNVKDNAKYFKGVTFFLIKYNHIFIANLEEFAINYQIPYIFLIDICDKPGKSFKGIQIRSLYSECDFD